MLNVLLAVWIWVSWVMLLPLLLVLVWEKTPRTPVSAPGALPLVVEHAQHLDTELQSCRVALDICRGDRREPTP